MTFIHPLWEMEQHFAQNLFKIPNFNKFTIITGEPINLNTTIDLANVVGTPYTAGFHLHAGHHKLVQTFEPDTIVKDK